MQIDGNVINTVNFFQGTFMIVLSLALGEALKAFTSDNQELPIHWDRLPALCAFLLIFFPFFQSMHQYFFTTYLNAQTALKFRAGYLIFDGVMNTLWAGCFFTMSRSLAPHRWRRFYGTLLILMLLDIAWNSVTYYRGLHVSGWLALNLAIVLAILAMMVFERGKPDSMRPSYVGLGLVIVTTAIGYWIESDMYFS